MGCLFAAKFAQAGNQVVLVDHDPETVLAIRSKGVQIKEGRSVSRVPIPIMKAMSDLFDTDLVLVMVKAYATKRVARELRGKIGNESTILTLQNGLGNMETLTRSFKRRVLTGSTTEASLRLGPGRIEHTGTGTTVVGTIKSGDFGQVQSIVRLLRNAGFSTTASRNVSTIVWSKAVLNSGINPVSALTRLRNGQLIKVAGMKNLILSVIEEGVRVAGAEGVALNVRHMSSLLSKVLRSTAQNNSSMLQDTLNGRRTEVRELNGIIAETGRKHRIVTPLNDILLRLVVALETGYS